MIGQEPTNRTTEIETTGSRLADLADRVQRGETRIVIEHDGVPIAALVSLADLASLDRLDRRDDDFFEQVDQLRDAFAEVPAAEIERETDRIVEGLRAEQRAEREHAAARR